MPWPRKIRSSLLRGAVASFAILLVIALTILAASPDLHERLHGHRINLLNVASQGAGHSGGEQDADDDDGCVVTLFAQGLVLPLAFLFLAFTGQVLRLPGFALVDRVAPESPRYLRLPTQAPPLTQG
jgi:hypothetical protein